MLCVFPWRHHVIKIFIFIEEGGPHQAQARNIAFIIHLTISAYEEMEHSSANAGLTNGMGFTPKRCVGSPGSEMVRL